MLALMLGLSVTSHVFSGINIKYLKQDFNDFAPLLPAFTLEDDRLTFISGTLVNILFIDVQIHFLEWIRLEILQAKMNTIIIRYSAFGEDPLKLSKEDFSEKIKNFELQHKTNVHAALQEDLNSIYSLLYSIQGREIKSVSQFVSDLFIDNNWMIRPGYKLRKLFAYFLCPKIDSMVNNLKALVERLGTINIRNLACEKNVSLCNS